MKRWLVQWKTFARDLRRFLIIMLYLYTHWAAVYGKRSAEWHVSATGREKKYEPLLFAGRVYNIIIKPLLLVLHNIIIGVEITPYYLYIIIHCIYAYIIYIYMPHIEPDPSRDATADISSRARFFRATARASGPKRNLVVCPCGGACVCVCLFYPHRRI